MLNTVILLVAAHALCDYPLQGDFLAKGKDPWGSFPRGWWVHCLTAHAAIHAGAVLLVAGSAWLALAEFVLHWLIDLGKCAGRYGFHTDQILHLACKAAWVAFIMAGGAQ